MDSGNDAFNRKEARALVLLLIPILCRLRCCWQETFPPGRIQPVVFHGQLPQNVMQLECISLVTAGIDKTGTLKAGPQISVAVFLVTGVTYRKKSMLE